MHDQVFKLLLKDPAELKNCGAFLCKGISLAIERCNLGQQTVRNPCQDEWQLIFGLVGLGLRALGCLGSGILSVFHNCNSCVCVLNKYVNSFNYKPEQPASLIALSLGVTPKASNRSDGIRATWQDITFSHFTQQLMIIPAFAKLDEIAHQAL